MKTNFLKIFAIISFLALSVSYVHNSRAISVIPIQETIVLNPTADTYVSAYRPTGNFGSGAYTQTGYMTSSGERFVYDTLIKFDISQIPQGSTINSANITLKRYSVSGIPTSLRLHTANSSWGESTVTWNSKPSLGNTGVSNTADPNWDKFVVTSFVQNMVRDTMPTPNYGFYIFTSTYNSPFYISHYSKEATSNKPTLTITFTRPTPTPTPSSSSQIIIPRLSIPPLYTPLPSIYIPPLTPDSTAPTISGVMHTVTSNSITIYWQTNEDSQGKVIYGKRGFWNLESQPTATGRSHSVTIDNLDPSTTYNYKIRTADRWANTRYSSIYEFDTLRSRTTPLPSGSAIPLGSPTPRASSAGSGGLGFGCGLFRFLPFSNCDQIQLPDNETNTPDPNQLDPDLDVNEGEDPEAMQDSEEEESAEPTTPEIPNTPLSNIPLVGGVFDSLGKSLEDYLAQKTIDNYEKNREATDSAQPTALTTNNPFVLVGSYVGINKIVGIALVLIGIIIAIISFIMLKLSHRTYHKFRGNSRFNNLPSKKNNKPFKK